MTTLFPIILLIVLAVAAFVRQVIRWNNTGDPPSKKRELEEMVGIGLVGIMFTLASVAASGYPPPQFGLVLTFCLFLAFLAWTRTKERKAALLRV